jgi:hypothetical protein
MTDYGLGDRGSLSGKCQGLLSSPSLPTGLWGLQQAERDAESSLHSTAEALNAKFYDTLSWHGA